MLLLLSFSVQNQNVPRKPMLRSRQSKRTLLAPPLLAYLKSHQHQLNLRAHLRLIKIGTHFQVYYFGLNFNRSILLYSSATGKEKDLVPPVTIISNHLISPAIQPPPNTPTKSNAVANLSSNLILQNQPLLDTPRSVRALNRHR